MRKLLIIFAIGLTGCGSMIEKKDKLIIKTIGKYIGSDSTTTGKYRYQFEGSLLIFYSDSVYKIGDKLKIGR